MGIDQLSVRCKGCGGILRQRQSCPKCAEAKRSVLHASGVCSEGAMLRREVDRAMARQRAQHERELSVAVEHLANIGRPNGMARQIAADVDQRAMADLVRQNERVQEWLDKTAAEPPRPRPHRHRPCYSPLVLRGAKY